MSELKNKCLKCGENREAHHTRFTPSQGCFPFCVQCFEEADRATIIVWYGELVRRWRTQGGYYTPEDEAVIVNAALKEKGFESWTPQLRPSQIVKE